MDENLRLVPTGEGGSFDARMVHDRAPASSSTDGARSPPTTSAVTPYKALSDQLYLFCRLIEKLGAYAYGQRIVDKMEEELNAERDASEVPIEVDPSVSYTLAKRLADRGVIVGDNRTSPDGTKRHVRVYQLTDKGRELMQLTRLFHEEQQRKRRPAQAPSIGRPKE